MKKLFLVIIVLLGLFVLNSCMGSKEEYVISVAKLSNKYIDSLVSKSGVNPTIYISDNLIRFEEISKEKYEYVVMEIPIYNIGLSPLIIFSADPSCGCMTTSYEKRPIKSGENVILQIRIDSKTQKGKFNKVIYIKSNSIDGLNLIRVNGIFK